MDLHESNAAPADAPEPKLPAGLEPLVDMIRVRLKPASIWLSGDSPRNIRREAEGWKVVVALPDDADPNLLDPILAWLIQTETGVPADIHATTKSALAEAWGKPTGIGHDLVMYGQRIM